MIIMSIPLISRLENLELSQDKKIPPPIIHNDLRRPGVIATLSQRSAEHDKFLLQYPVPAYHDIVKATKENAVVLDLLKNFGHEQHANLINHGEKVPGSFVSSLDCLDGETEVNYLRAAKKFVDMNSTRTSAAWATNEFKDGVLMQRGPLCEGTLAWLIHSPTDNQVDAAARLLYTLAAMYISPKTVQAYGANQKFKTKQLVEIFATSRIPGEVIDELRTHPSSTHAVVWSQAERTRSTLSILEAGPYHHPCWQITSRVYSVFLRKSQHSLRLRPGPLYVPGLSGQQEGRRSFLPMPLH